MQVPEREIGAFTVHPGPKTLFFFAKISVLATAFSPLPSYVWAVLPDIVSATAGGGRARAELSEDVLHDRVAGLERGLLAVQS